MDFDFTEEQRLLRDSVDRLLADRYTFDKRRAYLAEPEGWSRAMWAQYAELGLLGLPFAEEHGGFGGGGIETTLVMEAMGLVLAVAHGERQARYDLSDVLTTARSKAGGWVLDGEKSVVMHGDGAGMLVV